MKSFLFLLFLQIWIWLPAQLRAQTIKTDQNLQTALEEMLGNFKGTAGVYVYHLKRGEEAAVNRECFHHFLGHKVLLNNL